MSLTQQVIVIPESYMMKTLTITTANTILTPNKVSPS